MQTMLQERKRQSVVNMKDTLNLIGDGDESGRRLGR
jgi:hypothetical protein